MGIIGTIIIGFLAGLVARFLHPGRDPGGFIITTLLGIVGAVVATYLGQAVGWYRAGEGAGFIGAVVGAVIVLAINIPVRAGEAVGVRTDSAGRYRLPTLVHGMSATTLTLPVTAYRTDPSRGLVDSSRVSASILFFATKPPRDSTRVDLVVPWLP